MKNMRIVTFGILLLITSCASKNADPGNSEFKPKEVMSHIRYLASDELGGRMSGSVEIEQARAYIARHFESSGLKSMGDGDTYFQGFTFPSGTIIEGANYLKIQSSGNVVDFALGTQYEPLTFSGNGNVDGELVFAGYGISAPEIDYDDYNGVDVKGKVVLVLRYTPEGLKEGSPFYNYASLRYKAMNAREKGASAIIFTTPLSQKEEGSFAELGSDVSFLDSGIPALIIKRDIARNILGSFGQSLKNIETILAHKSTHSFPLGDVRINAVIKIVRKYDECANVIGYLEGSDPVLKDEVIVLGAHYDHIGTGSHHSRSSGGSSATVHNGADDNASGVAGLLELASYFAKSRESLKRSVLFIAFSAEEVGLLGSSYYVDHPKIPLDKTVAMINMDMIGRLLDNKLIVLGVGSSPDWPKLIEKSNMGTGLEISSNDTAFAPSDQAVFYAKDIPVLQFFTGLHTDYHTPEDDWDKINSEGETLVLELISNLVFDIDNRTEMIAYSEVVESERSASRFNVYLGTIPDYASQETGVRLMDVKKDSPADRAGLTGGDIIIAFDEIEIRNIYDYVYALEQSSPGNISQIVIIREGKRIDVRIVPEPRSTGNN